MVDLVPHHSMMGWKWNPAHSPDSSFPNAIVDHPYSTQAPTESHESISQWYELLSLDSPILHHRQEAPQKTYTTLLQRSQASLSVMYASLVPSSLSLASGRTFIILRFHYVRKLPKCKSPHAPAEHFDCWRDVLSSYGAREKSTAKSQPCVVCIPTRTSLGSRILYILTSLCDRRAPHRF